MTSKISRGITRVILICQFACFSILLHANEGRYEADPIFGGKVYVLEAGDPAKETLVLIHGMGSGASNDWTSIIKQLATDYHILTLDLPGFGRSSKENKAYNPTNYAKLIHHLTNQYASRPFHLLGHSMGGAIALRYAADHPNGVKTLTLVDPAGILHRMAYTKFLAPLGLDHYAGFSVPGRGGISDLAGMILERTEQTLPFDPALLMQFAPLRQKLLQGNPTAIAGFGLVQENFSQTPERIMAPTLIVWGKDDKVAPLRTGYVLDALIPKSYLKVIENAGHVPFKSRAQQFIALLHPHLNGSMEPASYTQKPAVSGKQKKKSCNGSKGQRYSGNFEILVLNNCKGITIVDAEITQLIIHNSHVTIENSTIRSDEVAMKVDNSSVIMTAGHVEGKVAISSYNSRFDIAGTTLKGGRAAVEVLSDSQLIFSLGRIESPNWSDTVIHGYKALARGQSL